MVAKTKTEVFRSHEYQEWFGPIHSTPMPIPPAVKAASAKQELRISDGHNLNGLGKYDVGGNFDVIRREMSESNFGPYHNRTTNDDSDGGYNYKGRYYANFTEIVTSDFPVIQPLSNSVLDASGTTAIARVIPTNPLTGLAVMLAEFRREGIPHILGADLLKRDIGRARAAGSEYLNAEFGWRPLVGGVLDLGDAILRSDDLMRQYEAESGKRLKRAYTFPTETTTTYSETPARAVPVIKTGYFSRTGTLATTNVITTKRWFEGVFTYHLAPQGSLARKEQLAAKRFGLRITPEVLWNLAPWSWAADWVTNLGDVIHNISAFANDGLTMPWGYMMCEQKHVRTYTNTGSRLKRGNLELSVWQQLTTVRKQRRKATPYGFGLDPTSFSGRQWAILGALGLTRGPRTLR